MTRAEKEMRIYRVGLFNNDLGTLLKIDLPQAYMAIVVSGYDLSKVSDLCIDTIYQYLINIRIKKGLE